MRPPRRLPTVLYTKRWCARWAGGAGAYARCALLCVPSILMARDDGAKRKHRRTTHTHTARLSCALHVCARPLGKHGTHTRKKKTTVIAVTVYCSRKQRRRRARAQPTQNIHSKSRAANIRCGGFGGAAEPQHARPFCAANVLCDRTRACGLLLCVDDDVVVWRLFVRCARQNDVRCGWHTGHYELISPRGREIDSI